MNLIERYSLSTGLKIDRPYIYEKYFPLPIDKYITFHPISKPSKNYDYWQDVIDDISPILELNGIKIVQIGAKEDHKYERCIRLNGVTSLNQVAYVLRNSLLHLSTDTFSAHMAGHLDKKLVALYSNSYVDNSRPYWGNPENQILLEPERLNGEKPSFLLEEYPKQINRIKTETISNHVLTLLGVKDRMNYETLFVGGKYQNHLFFNNIVPNDSGMFLKLNDIEIRMDKHFDENFLKGQLSHSRCAIVTDKPFDVGILSAFRPNISFLFYLVKDKDSLPFCKNAINLGIPTHFLSTLPQDEIDKLKIHYYSLGRLEKIPIIPNEDLLKLRAIPSDKVRIKSNKVYSRGNQRYYSMPDVWNNHPANLPFYKPITSTNFIQDGTLEDFEFLKLVKRLD
jgi:hypothetical protein